MANATPPSDDPVTFIQKWGPLLKVAGVIVTMLGTSSGAYLQASSEAKETADVGYKTTAARVAELEQAVNFLDAELSLLKAREVLAAHNVPKETIDELREIFASEGLTLPPATSQPAEARAGRARRSGAGAGFGAGAGRLGGSHAPAPPEPEDLGSPDEGVLAELTEAVKRAHATKQAVTRPEWLDEEAKPEMPQSLDEAAQQKIWLKPNQ